MVMGGPREPTPQWVWDQPSPLGWMRPPRPPVGFCGLWGSWLDASPPAPPLGARGAGGAHSPPFWEVVSRSVPLSLVGYFACGAK